ncbi:hypothetical protein RI129_002510 [Pyrocoelia pectoralis]|uniref:Cyclin B n=1 Tax=Pyrocoelia pectoralis TaxID=417401 RepID=A0AAN7ZTN6_9COLE
MEPNKIISCAANTSTSKYRNVKVAPQRKRILSDTRLLPSPKRDVASPNVKRRPPLGDLNKNVATFNKQSGVSSSKITITSHARTETKLPNQAAYMLFNNDEFHSDICDEYLETMVLHELKKDWKYVSPKGSVKCYQVHSRANVVNWLIKAQEYLNQPSTVFYKTVRLFDTVLAATDVPHNMYQLISFVIMWIVTKFENVHFPTTKKLAKLCNNVYTIEQILKLEKKLLVFFGFDLNVPDTIFYVDFYIIKLNHPSELLYNAVEYILECYILHKTSSTVIASVQAAAAVSLALNLLHPTSQLWDSLSNIVGYYSDIELNDVMQDMLKQIHKVQDPKYECRYPFEKYSAQEKQKVATILLRKLIAS